MLTEAKVLHDSVKDLYLELLPLLTRLEEKTQEDMITTMGYQQVDTAYACRDTIALLDALKKKINKLYRISQTIASTMMTVDNKDKLTTQHATASKNPKLWFKITTKREKNPEEHDKLLEFCGVPKEIAEAEIVRLHPPNFMEMITTLIGRGDPVPVDMENITATNLDLRITKRKEI